MKFYPPIGAMIMMSGCIIFCYMIARPQWADFFIGMLIATAVCATLWYQPKNHA